MAIASDTAHWTLRQRAVKVWASLRSGILQSDIGGLVRDLSDVSLKPSEFNLLAELCRQDRDFPAKFAEWQRLIAQASSDAHHRALYPDPLLLDVREFAEWCTRLKIMPCLDALRAFVIIKRREVS